MATSVRLAKYESEGNDEELLTKIVADVQDPAAPIFEAARHRQRSHDAGSVLTRLDEMHLRCRFQILAKRRWWDHPSRDRLPNALVRPTLISDEVGVIAMHEFVAIRLDPLPH
jgi:hypothetical protein